MELIDRQAAFDALEKHIIKLPEYIFDDCDANWNYAINCCRWEIEDLPSVQLEQRIGHWIILDSDSERYEDIKCPFCGHTFTVDAGRWCDIGFIKEDFNFCPNCGTKME